ncbi:hypothetical protein H6G33_34470 [Calothrix sp. FACHB-1219]|uniref:hypothetical protein n=1 Tax=unclassified Calothrix TaxID=2619626 RepID=UPI001684AE85|nr:MULTISPECIES: hypothetical protein [unclassified Calothrix]MBD2207453.1 hypothetical protein [Calothrix sp. FACHB-168]MBD2222048.1 hypothetical protein [Calothrix sp. FACHB-1219]
MKCSFISLYQEKAFQEKENTHSTDIILGTQTRTDSREELDQDPDNRGTQTSTRARENPDIDYSNTKFTVIPR